MSINNMQRLIYLCHTKNELNRKRRRFYYLMGDKNSPISKKQAEEGYRSAQSAMKAMTQEMRAMRVEMGVEFVWNDGGLISAIKFNGGRLCQTKFKQYYESEVFEMELFGRGENDALLP